MAVLRISNVEPNRWEDLFRASPSVEGNWVTAADGWSELDIQV